MININKRHPFFKTLDFIVRAVLKNCARESLRGVQIKNNTLLSSDGHIACRVDVSELEAGPFDDGLYRVELHTKWEIVLVPVALDVHPHHSINKVFPTVTGDRSDTITIPRRGKIKDTYSLSVALYRLTKAGCFCLDFYHLSLLCGTEERKFDVWFPIAPQCPVYFRSGALEAVMLPLRLKEE